MNLLPVDKYLYGYIYFKLLSPYRLQNFEIFLCYKILIHNINALSNLFHWFSVCFADLPAPAIWTDNSDTFAVTRFISDYCDKLPVLSDIMAHFFECCTHDKMLLFIWYSFQFFLANMLIPCYVKTYMVVFFDHILSFKQRRNPLKSQIATSRNQFFSC